MTNREVAQRIAAMRERLARLRDRIQVNPIQMGLHAQIVEELQAALEVLETAQESIPHRDSRAADESSQAVSLPTLPKEGLLLREIHHRVKNNLQLVASLLDLQVMQTEDPKVRDLLKSNQSRISLIALLHQSLSESPKLTEINFSEYVRSLAVTVFRVYAMAPDRIELQLEIAAEVTVHPDKAIPIGLVLNELISNALKYGFEHRSRGSVRVSLASSSEGEITLSVSNQGDFSSEEQTGDFQFDLNSTNSLGLQLVQSLVRQINGVLTVEQGDRTTFTLQFRGQYKEHP